VGAVKQAHAACGHVIAPMKPCVLMAVNAEWYFLSHRLPLARALRAAGCRVAVAAAVERGLDKVIEDEGFEFIRLPLTRRASAPWREWQTLRALVALNRHVRPTVVHNITIKPVIYGSIAARLTGTLPVINTIPGLGHMFSGQGLVGRLKAATALLLYRVALAHPRVHVIFQNGDDLALFVERGVVPRDRAHLVLGSGVDADEFVPRPEPDGPPVVMLPSRLLWNKGVAEFVEAARTLRAAGLELRPVLVGRSDTGNPDHVPDTTLRSWVADGLVEWWGERDDMPAVLSQATLVTLPSAYREGVPRVLIEAASCERAIIASDSPGCREIVRHGETGLLVPVRDAAALAAAIRELLADPARRRRMAAEARDLAEREFSVDRVNAATLAVYEEVLGSGWTGAPPR
jgi:glycosyltransferase involved in cell wall biosynthesis